MANAIELDYKLEPGDYFLHRARPFLWLFKFAIAVISAGLICLAYYFFLAPDDLGKKDLLLTFILTVLIIFLLRVLLLLVGHFSKTRRIKRKLKKSSTLNLVHKALIDADGVRVESAGKSTMVKWSLVDSVRLTKSVVLFLRKKDLLLAIPVRAFETTEQSENFVDILKEKEINMQYKSAEEADRADSVKS